jgi:signal transduction histidine kinase
MRLTRHSIGTTILVAFIAMSAVIALLGAGGYLVLSSAGDMVTGTYDGPLMAVNYARAASVDFVQMQQSLLRRRYAPARDYAGLDRAIDDLAATFFADLDVAQNRSDAADEHAVIVEIRTLVRRWQTTRKQNASGAANGEVDALEKQIMDRFDMLIELNTDHSFVGRRKAVWSISYFKYSTLAAIFVALMLALTITVSLTRRIMRPLSSAARVADRIAAGELQTPIPQGGKDETGTLLRSMTVMQDNIRTMMERETARAHSAEARLLQALETSREGVLLIGPDGRILLVNERVREFFPSVSGQSLAGTEFSRVATLAATHLAGGASIPTLKELGIARDTAASGSAERQLLDGRWIRITGSIAGDGAFIFFLSDLTAIKEREENFRMAKHAAEAASAAKSRFLANMSHELRTPLNAIIGFSEMISGEIFGPVGNNRYAEYATDIVRSGRHLLDIINSVLDLSRSDAGKLKLQNEVVDVRYVLRDCSKMLRDLCDAGNLTLDNLEPEEPAVVAGEKAKLRQIFLNLLSNAVKFTEPGGRISIAVRQDAEMVTIEIADTGIGMSADDIAVALTPFGQVDNRLARRYEGTGLGLPLTKSLVDLHNGSLEIESAPMVGTTVRVHLPRARAGEMEEPAAAVS